MISRYLTLGKVPELRLEPQSRDEEHPVPEIEIALDVEDFWELSQLMTQFRYAQESGQSTRVVWKKISKIVTPSVVTERDRTWFARQRK